MQEYSSTPAMPDPVPTSATTAVGDDNLNLDDFDLHRKTLLTQSIQSEGWREELRCYLTHIPSDVTKETDIVAWWGVSNFN